MASGHVNRISKAEHMAAPTNAANVKKVLANAEPSTHGTSRTSRDVRFPVAIAGTQISRSRMLRHHRSSPRLDSDPRRAQSGLP
jgi:hypothetical protein